MKNRILILFNIFFCFCLTCVAQQKSNTENDQLFNYEKKDAIIFDFSNYNEYNLVSKYFNYSFQAARAEEDDEINERIIKSFDFDILSKNKEKGVVYFEDTFYYPPSLNFEDGSFAIKTLFSKNINYTFNYNKYGFYLFNFIIRSYTSSDILIPISVKVRNNCIILKSRFNLYLYKSSLFLISNDKKPYNDPTFAFRGEVGLIFRPTLAYNQLNRYAQIFEMRSMFKDQILGIFQDIIKIKK
jgi:hypothetical protein